MISLMSRYHVRFKVELRGGMSHAIHHECGHSIFYFVLVIVLILICTF